jgi:hypothetical protein
MICYSVQRHHYSPLAPLVPSFHLLLPCRLFLYISPYFYLSVAFTFGLSLWAVPRSLCVEQQRPNVKIFFFKKKNSSNRKKKQTPNRQEDGAADDDDLASHCLLTLTVN